MYRKYFFKNKGVLSRRFVASGLAAVFSAGMFGSYAGAMEPEQDFRPFYVWEEELELANVLKKNSIKGDDKNAEKFFEFFIYNPDLMSKLQVFATNFLGNEDENNEELLENEATRLYAYLLLFKFYKFNDKTRIDDFLIKCDLEALGNYFYNILTYLKADDATNLLNKIKDGWGNELLGKVKREKLEKEKLKKGDEGLNLLIKKKVLKKIEYGNEQSGSEDISLQKSISKHELYENIKNKTKNKFRKAIIVVSIVSVFIILLVIFFAIKPAGKSKTNTGVPNNNKDDEKVNPSIEPEKDKDDEKVNPSIEPEKDKDDEKVNPSIEPEKDKDDEKVNPSIEPEKDKDDEKVNPSIEPEKDKDDEKVNPSIEPEKDKDDEKVNPSIEPEKDKDDEKVNPSIEPEKDKDDEKVKPPIDPREPSSDPESDEQNTEQNNQEERPSVVPSNILKATGATVTAGTLAGGTYLFNKVLKSGKPSEVKNPKNVNNGFMYLDSAGNKVTKTEEGRKDNYDNDDKNADNSGTKQLLEDKSTEKTEEGQEEILERSALSDDTEATSDEEKNKD